MHRTLTDARHDFPALSQTRNGQPVLFMDGPAGTQVPQQVIDEISAYYRSSNANSGGFFRASVETDAMIEDTRAHVAAFLGASSAGTISFGQNMTTLTFSLSRAIARRLQKGDEIVVTELDHEANRGPWLSLEREGIVVREVAMKEDGRLDYEDFESKVNSRTRLVALGMASNALGTVNDVQRAREISRSVGALLLLDAVHYAPHFSVDVSKLEADFLLCSAYKFYGPHVGVLYARPGLLDELETDRLNTAHQEAPERIETGTLNHAAIAGVRAAVQYIASWSEGATLRERLVRSMRSIGQHERTLAARYWNTIGETPAFLRWGPDFSEAQRAPTVSITHASAAADELALRLAERGIAVWSGDFYARRAVAKLGLADQGGILRSGFFIYHTEQDVDRLIAALREAAAE